MKITRASFIVLGPVLAVLFTLALKQIGLEDKAAIAAGITLLTVIWWVTEAVPIAAASLVPFALLPVFGVVGHKEVAGALGSHVI